MFCLKEIQNLIHEMKDILFYVITIQIHNIKFPKKCFKEKKLKSNKKLIDSNTPLLDLYSQIN